MLSISTSSLSGGFAYRLGNLFAGRWFYIYLAVTLACASALLLTMNATTTRIRNVEQAATRTLEQTKINALALDLDKATTGYYHLAHEVAAGLSIAPDTPHDELAQFVRHLMAEHPSTAFVAAAPDLVVRDVFSATAPDENIALSFLNFPDQVRSLQLVAQSGETAAAGPGELLGEKVVLWNAPVMVPATSEAKDHRFWGVVTVAVSLDRLLEEGGLNKVGPVHEFVLMREAPDGYSRTVITGDPAVLQNAPVSARIALGGMIWQLSAHPKGGWPESPDYLATVLSRFLMYGLVFFMIAMLATRFVQQRSRAEQRLRNAIDSLNDGFAYFDRNDRLMLWNQRYKAFSKLPDEVFHTGISFEVLLREGLARGLYPEAEGREEAWLAERVATHSAQNSLTEQQQSDGRWLQISETLARNGGRVSLVVDISKLKDATQKAEEANRAKSEFVSVISHELRTPLTAILGYASFLTSPKILPSVNRVWHTVNEMPDKSLKADEQLDTALEEMSSYAEKMKHSGSHLLILINDLLDLSKIEAGRMEVNIAPVHVDKAVADVIASLQNEARTKGLKLGQETDGGIVMADETRLTQMLTNLVGNAIKFTETGTITVKTTERRSFVEFQVVDTGCGIPASEKGKLFKRFSQVDSSATRKAGGTGLGLAITRELAHLHGGKIGVESDEGKGSTFWFTIPKLKHAKISEILGEALQSPARSEQRRKVG